MARIRLKFYSGPDTQMDERANGVKIPNLSQWCTTINWQDNALTFWEAEREKPL